MKNNIRKLRHTHGMTQKELADKVGVGVPQISRWEIGDVDIPVSRMLRLSRVFGVPVGDILIPDPSAVRHDGDAEARAPNGVPVPMEGPSAERMREDLPIFGTALGATKLIDGESVEQTYLNTGDVVHYAKRPVILNGRSDAYGLYVQGDSMAPVHLGGDLTLVETKRPPRIGDDIVLYLRPLDEQDDGERARMVLIKRLVRRTPSYVELEQFNPPLTFKVETSEIIRMDRIMRLADLIA